MSFIESAGKYKGLVNNELESFFSDMVLDTSDSFISFCYDVIKRYSLSGGKRLRPVSMILAYNACRGEDKKIILPALAIELHHTYSLILDDIMDEDETRRHNPTVYKIMKDYFLKNFQDQEYDGSLFSKRSSRFAASFGIMLGNITNILSKQLIVKSDFNEEMKYKALKLMEDTDRQIYHGQMLDVLMEHKQEVTEKHYLEMINLKTSVLFGLAFQLGSLFAGKDEHTQHMFREFGTISALSFQIQDDIIDLMGDKGHEQGSDIKKGKKTLLVIKALEKADDYQKKILMKIFGDSRADENAIMKVIGIMKDTGALDYARKFAISKNNDAKEILKRLDLDSYHKQIFSEYADFLFNRSS
ncbi:polyprenyl synthetase family protein [Candidatus Woesearchaeota archaeon]|nr:polyprenyl synthetase family protein [Candidatus Woesearchaeota archaeon]